MFRYTLCSLLFLPVTVSANECPKEGEPIHTTPYTKTVQCPAATLIIEGEANPKEYQDCLGLVPSAKESVFFANKSNSHALLPPVNSLYPKESKNVQSRVWLASNVKCKDANTINVLYWGGGNCVGCEQPVRYTFNQNGELVSAKSEGIDPDVAPSQRYWQTSVLSVPLKLNVSDKFCNGDYIAKYIVKSDLGHTYIAEKNGGCDANSSEVNFPPDFHEEVVVNGKTISQKPVLVGFRYSVFIYANDELVNSGKIEWKTDADDDPGQYVGP